MKRRALIHRLFDRQRTDVYTTATGCIRLLARAVGPDEALVPVPVQVGFSPGRHRRAVDRNRIKRLLREAYRLHQHELMALFDASDEALTLMILFRGNPADAAVAIPRDLPRALQRLTAYYRRGPSGP